MGNACIILGRDNDAAGNPDSHTIARLKAAEAHLGEATCVVLTGYDPHNQSMRQWLGKKIN